MILDREPDWDFWRAMPRVEPWMAVDLSFNIDPDMRGYREIYNWSLNGAVSKRERLVNEYLTDIKSSRLVASRTADGSAEKVKLPEFAAWALWMGWEIPPELAALAKEVSVPIEVTPSSATSSLRRAPRTEAKSKRTVLRRALLLTRLRRYPKLLNAMRANDREFKECRVSAVDSPGGKSGFYYVESVEAVCAARWGAIDEQAPLRTTRSALSGARGIRNGQKFGK